MGRLDQKVAIVTVAAQGIGRAIAEKAAGEGATLVVSDLDEDQARQTAQRLTGEGHLALVADVTDRTSVNAMVTRVREQLGRIDVLVNNAGWDVGEPFCDSDPATWDTLIGINLYGVLHTCHAVLPVMAAQGSGSVVNLGSDAGRVGSSGEAVYAAAKGGVISFTKTIAREATRGRIHPLPRRRHQFRSVAMAHSMCTVRLSAGTGTRDRRAYV